MNNQNQAGPSRDGHDGHDHAFRQRVAAHYAASAVNKTRLKYCIFFHYILAFFMLAKLSPYILDKFNFFILAIEELEVPEPAGWEWLWLLSIFASIIGLDAMKKNSIKQIQIYAIMILVLGYVPLMIGFMMWLPDVSFYLFTEDNGYFLTELVYWKGYPYGLLWYAFILLALQVHSFSLYFVYKLMVAWKARGVPRRAE